MFCGNCGSMIEYGDRFCTVCGTLSSSAASAPGPQPSMQPHQWGNPQSGQQQNSWGNPQANTQQETWTSAQPGLQQGSWTNLQQSLQQEPWANPQPGASFRKSRKPVIIAISAAAALLMVAIVIIIANTRPRPAPPLTVTELLNLGEQFLLELNYEQALVQFLRVIEIEPMNPRGYTGAAESFVGLGRADEAVSILRQGLDVIGDNAAIENMLAGLDPSSQEVVPPPGASNWRELYLEELEAALAYAANPNWANHDWSSSRYPLYQYGYMLADLDFNGVPELFLYGDGVSNTEFMRVYTITHDGVELIHHGIAGSLQLYRSRSDGSLAYLLRSGTVEGDGSYEDGIETLFFTDSTTVMDSRFGDNARIAEATWHYTYNGITYWVWGERSYSFEFDGREVSGDEYHWLLDRLLSGFDEVSYTPASLWTWGINVTIDDMQMLLDSYIPET